MKIIIGRLYRHKRCEIYKVRCITNVNTSNWNDYRPQVVYERLSDGTIWSRDLIKFNENSFTLIEG